MNWALGYVGRDLEKKGKTWTGLNTFKKKKSEDPDAIDIDKAQIDPAKWEKLMKSGSCFHCKKQEHLAKNYLSKKPQIQEASSEPTKKKEKNKQSEEKPPSYKTIIKQINLCSMEEWQKLLELFGKEDEEEDFWKAQLAGSLCKPTM